MTRSLSVWWEGAIAGTLGLNKDGAMSFVYAPEWLADPTGPPISISLPKREQRFGTRECRPFFAGLLPEEAQLEGVARALGISKGNDFGLLEALGGDVAGALTLWPEDSTPSAADRSAKAKVLEESGLAELIDTLPRRPLLAGEDGLRLSLAGAQAKLPVTLVDGRVAKPAPGQPTTHILKPPIERFPAITANEAFVMRLAAAVGLQVAPIEARVASGRPYLLVARYDRRLDEAGAVHRLHQEDFCQALGIPPEHKYAHEGGPTFKTSFELIRRATTRPAVEVLKLLDAAIFNVLVGNADAHGKNFSLLYDGGRTTLAPLYDLVCTVAYDDLSAKLAMKIARHATLEEIGKGTWPAFALEVGLGAPFVRKRVKALAESARGAVARVVDETAAMNLDRDGLKALASLIASRAEQLAKTTP